MGRKNSVSEAVAGEVKNIIGKTPVRVGGKDRYEVSVNSAQFRKAPQKVMITTGQVYSDALIAAPYAQKEKATVSLVGTTLSQSAKNYLNAVSKVQTEIIGGKRYVQAAMEQEIAYSAGTYPNRIGGADRYEVSASLVKKNFGNAQYAFLASDQVFSDALSASSAAQKLNAPILLTQKHVISTAVLDAMKDNSKLYVMGGVNTIAPSVLDALKETLHAEESEKPSPRMVVDISKLPKNVQKALKTLRQDMSTVGAQDFVAALQRLTPLDLLNTKAFGASIWVEALVMLQVMQAYGKILDGTYHDDQINTVLALLNVEREKAGAPAVKLDPVLQKLAKTRAKESTGLMTHIRSDGLKYQVEFNKTGMYTKMGESVASVPSAPEFIESLMNHAPHRHAVINPEFTQVGIGVCEAEDGRFFWEIVYGRQGSLYNPNFKLKDLSLLYRK